MAQAAKRRARRLTRVRRSGRPIARGRALAAQCDTSGEMGGGTIGTVFAVSYAQRFSSLALCFAVTAACNSDGLTELDGGAITASDASSDQGLAVAASDASSNQGPDRAWTHATMDGRASSALNADASPPMCGAGTVDASPAVVDAGDASAAFDAGTPPPDCIPPCVWDLMKNCLPAGPCVRQAYEHTGNCPSPLTDGISAACWSVDQRREIVKYCDQSVSKTVYVGNRLCYGESLSGQNLGPTIGELWNSAGERVAGGTGSLSDPVPRTIACGPPGFFRDINCAVYGQCDGGQVIAYHFDIDQPHCAPWRPLWEPFFETGSCNSGCCPREPPVGP